MFRRGFLVAALALVVLGAPPVVAAPRGVPCAGDPSKVHRLEVTIGGQRTWGLYALPAGRAKGLVAFAHGYGHTPASWRTHLSRVARQEGVIAFAMDYRGSYVQPDGVVRGWRVAEGAADTIHVARMFDRACRPPVVVAYGVSMGANTSGLALATSTGLFDWWIDVEGAANVIETYQEARAVARSGNAFARNAQADIEAEMGGPFESRRDVYLERTVVHRAGDIAASGVQGVVIVHGVADGLVPYDQSRELAAALRAEGVPVQFFTVGTRGDGEPGTTLDGYAPVPHESPFAGHASEASETHVVGRLGFDRLRALLRGEVPDSDREVLVP